MSYSFFGGKKGSFETENNYFNISISNAGIDRQIDDVTKITIRPKVSLDLTYDSYLFMHILPNYSE